MEEKQPKEHLLFLDGVRGIAIFAVFLYHSLGASFGFYDLPWNGLFRSFEVNKSFLALYPLAYGYYGVAIFFVVSGFCIHLSHQRTKSAGWLDFYNRRFFRIYPPYLLAVVTFFFLWPWGSFSINNLWRLVQLGSHLLMIHNFDQRTFFGINPSFWSVAVEMQLYAIYPLFLFITRAHTRTGLLLIALIELLIQAASSFHTLYLGVEPPRFLSSSPFAFWFSWSVGAYLAQCYFERRRSGFSGLRFGLIAVVAVLLPLFKPTAPFTFLAMSLLAGIAIDKLIAGEWVIPRNKGAQWAWRHLSFLGVISYSFYLFHQPIVDLTREMTEFIFPGVHFHQLAIFAFCCAWYPLILALSYLLYRTIEQPSVALGKAAWRRLKRQPA